MLSKEMKNVIYQYDNSRVFIENKHYLIKNLDEEITGIVTENGGNYFKYFKSFNGNEYVYDSVSNKIAPISSFEKEILMNPKKSIDFLEQLKGKEFELQFPIEKNKEIEGFSIRTLLINTTEQCNLRCTYCYFGGGYENTRIHNNSKISFPEIKPLIDKFINQQEALKNSQRAIYFFGGEPLINFRLIKEIVIYIYSFKETIDISNLIFQVASNATLINDEIAEFFQTYNVHLNISIDGPDNDKYRLDVAGNGTLKKVTEKLEMLNEKFPVYYSNYVGIACVVNYPYDIKSLYEFFSDWEPAQNALHIGFDLVLFNYNSLNSSSEMDQAKKKIWELFIETHKYGFEKRSNSWIYFFSTGFNFLHQSFSQVLWRKLHTDNDNKVKLNGIKALPGLFISTIGTDGGIYSTFEFQSHDYLLGNINKGLDRDKVMNFVQNLYDANSNGSCCTCWAARLCKLDYPDFYISQNDDLEIVNSKLKAKQKRCAQERNDITLALSAIETIKENFGGESLNYMEEQKKNHLEDSKSDPWLPYQRT
ncbi:radical SAM protein [Paenibacillus campi]|uniref:radical SAM protein n=1 Tax=Paenibacillus campi TaxID=3106031 RepID=UPI002AFE6082|nr:radical SAM protein [Paenibacillus sp. SGZ-1014]